MKNKLNNFFCGFSLGLILPFIATYVFYLLQKSYHSLNNFIAINYKYGSLPGILTFCLMINIPVVYYLLKREYYKGARGAFTAIVLWSVFILYLKFK
ncbi:MAG: hypothetical protein N3A01_04190 [Bacteroidales bacterium]|nr:hypothetical protein [Bacteroidales bacterium]